MNPHFVERLRFSDAEFGWVERSGLFGRDFVRRPLRRDRRFPIQWVAVRGRHLIASSHGVPTASSTARKITPKIPPSLQ
jgi:hypothetical protein